MRHKLTLVDASVVNISDGGRLDDVTDHELLDRLIFRYTSCTIGASDELHVATVVLVTSVVSSFGCLVVGWRCGAAVSVDGAVRSSSRWVTRSAG